MTSAGAYRRPNRVFSMTSCYDAGGERREDGGPMDEVNRARLDLELRVVEAMREHRRLAGKADTRHRTWKQAAKSGAQDRELAELRESYRAALFEAQSQQMALARLVDELGFVPVMDGDGTDGSSSLM